MNSWFITDGVLHDDTIPAADHSIRIDIDDECTEFTVPEGVKEIADEAFCGCEGLESITLPCGLEKIGDFAFHETDLKHVTIPASVKEIGTEAFSCCEKLKSVTLCYGVEKIGDGAFGKTAIELICIPDSVTEIGKSAFAECRQLTGVSLSRSIDKIELLTFSRTALRHIAIPAGVKEIGEEAFSACTQLESITFREGLEKIGRGAFYGHEKLQSLTFPASLREISELAFSVDITMKKLEPEERLILHILYNDKALAEKSEFLRRTLEAMPDAVLDCVTLNEGIEKIGYGAFFGCRKLRDVAVPASVTELGDSALAPYNLFDIYPHESAREDWDGDEEDQDEAE